MRRLGSAAAALGVLLTLLHPAPARAAHYCTAATGTLLAIPLPHVPGVLGRTSIYIHDRARTTGTGITGNPLDPDDRAEGLWIYIENEKKPGYQPGGVSIVVGLAPLSDTDCGATKDSYGLRATPAEFADDLIL